MSVLDNFRLEGSTIVVTGASSGIGRAIAVACAEAGATVACIGRNPERLQDLMQELNGISSAPHFSRSFDVTDYAGIPGLIAEIVAKCGRIGGFVHSAGIAMTVPLKTMTPELYERIYATNVIAGFEFAKAITLKKNLAADCSVVLISSVAAVKGEAGLLAYSASKGAVLSGSRSLAAELAGRKVRVNCLSFANIIDTPMGAATIESLPTEYVEKLKAKHLLGMGEASCAVGPAIFLLSQASKWITGTSLMVDGGYCL